MVLGGVLPNTPVVNVLVIVVATGFVWLGSGWLEEAAGQLSVHYGLPTVVVAVGSSFPEFATVLFTAIAGVFDMGVGGVVGSAIFNILVVPALSGLASDAELDARTARHSDRRRAASRCGRVARGGVRDPGVSGGCHHRRGRHQPPRHVGDVRTARVENSATSLGNVLGSNTFDLLVVIPIGVLIVGAVTVDFATAVPMFGVLTLATVLLFGFLRTDLSLTSAETDALLGAYLLFVAWIVAESVGATNVLKAT